MSGLLALATGIVMSGEGSKSSNISLSGDEFPKKLANYKAGNADNYSTEFFKKLAEYERLYGTVESPFRLSQSDQAQSDFAAKARTTSSRTESAPFLIFGKPWYYVVLPVVGVVAVIVYFMKRKKRRR